MRSLLTESRKESVFRFSEAWCNSLVARGGEWNLVTVCTEVQRWADENSRDHTKGEYIITKRKMYLEFESLVKL